MPTKCPHRGSCGALIPGWLVGDHPSVKEGEVGRAICFSRNMFQCCFDSKVIWVRNCGSFYVYYLAPMRCPYRYCFTDD